MRSFLTLLPTLALPLAAAEITFTPLNEPAEAVQVLADGKPFATYRADTRVPCLYPLIGPAGTTLIRHYPFKDKVEGESHDHPHHCSFWLTHGNVNGQDFWHKKENRIVHKKSLGDEAGQDGWSTQTVALEWTAGDQAVLKERRQYAYKSTPETRLIDLRTELSPVDGDVTFGDTKEGFFAIRLTPTLRLDGPVGKGKLVNSEGVEGKAAWGKRAKWVAYHGPDSAGNPTVVALLDHPSNLRHPTWWHARTYGLGAANPFGISDFEKGKKKGAGDHILKTSETLKFKYGLILHQGSIESAKIEDRWAEFSKR